MKPKSSGTRIKPSKYPDELVGLFDLMGEDMQEAIRADVEQRDPLELALEFGRVEELLGGLEYSAEGSHALAGEIVFGEARKLAGIARYICEQQAQ